VKFRPEDYGPEIGRILDLAGGGQRPMPLVRCASVSRQACDEIEELRDGAIRAGLYLHCGCWDLAHETADSVHNPDGHFWHAIVHRQEPDADNSAYWFRMTGSHPLFPRLAEEAEAAGYQKSAPWDPFAFIQFCEWARQQPASAEARLAAEVQLLEWQLLFDHCARGKNG